MFILSLDFGNYKVYEWLMLLALLIPQTITDLRDKSIRILPNVCVSIFSHLLIIRGGFITHLVVLIPGLIFMVISFLSKESIGLGDGVVVLSVGCIVGLEQSFKVMFYASCMAASISLFMLLIKKADRKTKLPFIPFILAGTILGGFA